MLQLKLYFKSLRELHVTIEEQAACFGTAVGTISNWINGTRKPRKSLQELLEGNEMCRDHLRQDKDTFINGLICHLGVSERETILLREEYCTVGYDAFIKKFIGYCMYHREFQSDASKKQITDDRDYFLNNYHKRLFWSYDTLSTT